MYDADDDAKFAKETANFFFNASEKLMEVNCDEKWKENNIKKNLRISDTFIMWCYDMKEFDYSSTHISLDGKTDKSFNVKKSTSVIMKVEKFE